jgi:hypothetical protein
LALQDGVLSPVTVNMLKRRLNNDVYPTIGKVPISDLKAKDILEKVLRPIESRGTLETAHRVRGVILSPPMKSEPISYISMDPAKVADFEIYGAGLPILVHSD